MDQVALNEETTVYFASVEGRSVHCEGTTDRTSCLDSLKTANLPFNTVWLGNSQLHAINQFREGEASSVETLHKKLFEMGDYLVSFSQPNANLQEHYMLLEYLKTQIKIDTLILPLVFDDTRETGIRAGLQYVFENEVASSEIAQSSYGERLIKSREQATGGGQNDTSGSLQELSESRINEYLESKFLFWQQRGEVRASIFLNLYKLRNSVFGISASTVRRLIPGRYKDNMTALDLILKSCEEAGILAIPYIAPIRSDVDIPYEPEEYKKFLQDSAEIVNRYNFTVYDFSDKVPGELWGSKESTALGGEAIELDFMHFQSDGHQLLADELEKALWLEKNDI